MTYLFANSTASEGTSCQWKRLEGVRVARRRALLPQCPAGGDHVDQAPSPVDWPGDYNPGLLLILEPKMVTSVSNGAV